MTDTGADFPRAEDPQREDPRAEHGSRLQQYRTRVEEWAFALRDGAEQHAPPEMLGGLAGTARKVAQFLDGMAERAREKQAKEEVAAGPTEEASEATEQAPEATQHVERPSTE
jgi:hypothetical protein